MQIAALCKCTRSPAQCRRNPDIKSDARSCRAFSRATETHKVLHGTSTLASAAGASRKSPVDDATLHAGAAPPPARRIHTAGVPTPDAAVPRQRYMHHGYRKAKQELEEERGETMLWLCFILLHV